MTWVLIVALGGHYAYNIPFSGDRMVCERAGAHEYQTIYASKDHDKSVDVDWVCIEAQFMPPRGY